MHAYVAEVVGTALLCLMGNGVVANVVLSRTKGNSSGWIVISAGWGMAVFVAVCCAATASGAHLNPAVTLGLAAADRFAVADVVPYIGCQMLGAMLGATLVYAIYAPHYRVTEDAEGVRATFCTSPAIPDTVSNLLSEMLGTFVLVFVVLSFSDPSLAIDGHSDVAIGLGSLGALPVGLLVFAIGLSLGGTTGYAINPARDLGPRIVHQLLPIAGKGPSDWHYAWIPVAGPVVGGIAAAFVWRMLAA